jgi:LysM repeat protein
VRTPFVLLALLAVTLPGSAAERLHTVVAGESASAIAQRYYGDYSHTDLVLRFNGRADTDLRPGERLRIPYCKQHRIEHGDNGSTLAQRYLGRSSAWAAIAGLNGLIPEAPLQPGETISIPVILRHTLVRGDSLSGLAGTYYDDPQKAEMLQAFNRIADPRDLAVGDTVEVPIAGVSLKPPPPEPPVVAKPKPVLPTWFAGEFSSAEQAYARGDYETALEEIRRLTGRVDQIPVAEKRSDVWRLAAFVEIAFDRDESACASFESMRSTGTPLDLDPGRVSPKILAALEACGSR